MDGNLGRHRSVSISFVRVGEEALLFRAAGCSLTSGFATTTSLRYPFWGILAL
jgi:hypothetical protein